MKLYHFTCGHGAAGIMRDRWLRGNPHPYLPDAGPLIHLTDLDTPAREACGLTSTMLACDRMEYRVTVVTSDAVHWPRFARGIPREVREQFEGVPGAMPMHWYVAQVPIPVLAVGRFS